MTDDRFLHSLRREPRAEFARGLWSRLAPGGRDEERAPRRLVPALGFAVAALAVVSLFVFPSVRASAQAFLDVFRVRRFVAVSFDPERFQRLKESQLDLEKLIGEKTEVLQKPGPIQSFATAEAASAAAGTPARKPTWLPSGFVPDTVMVRGEGRVRIEADADRLRELMSLLEVRDLEVPPGLDGAMVEIHAYPALRHAFRGPARASGERRALLMHSRSPEVSLPAGIELARLAEIGLRLLGTPEADARRLAERTDWRSTLLVPVPADAESFQEVDVDGARGLLVASRERGHRLLLWSRGDEVFALGGELRREDLLRMAESVR